MKVSSDLKSHLYGNPHSQSPSSILSTQRIETTRVRMLEFFKADPQHFDLIFVANATAAIKLVADGMRGDSYDKGFWYGYHAAAHSSLVGVRELATAGSRCFNSDEEVENWLLGVHKQSTPDASPLSRLKLRLFAFPAQSNMNGRRLPLDWPGRLRASPQTDHQNVYTLLDAAAYVTTAQLDLSDHLAAPDFVALSFHKIFGFPDLGALIVRKDAGHVLRRRGYFGGGTIDMVINGAEEESWHAPKLGSLHEALEDGTPAFHSILALEPALEVHRKLYRDMTSISRHTCRLAKDLYESMAMMSHGNGIALCRIYREPASHYGDARSQGPTISFNIQSSTQEWVGKSYVEKLAIVNGIQLRTGGVCNPGGIAWALDLTAQEMRENYAEGLRCGNGVDELNGKPTGIIRVSLGAMSTTDDVVNLLSFLRLFIEEDAGYVGVPRVFYEKKSVQGPITTRVREIPTTECTTTSVAMTLNEKPTKKPGDPPQQYPEYACPVARCRAVTLTEEELLEHFQVHKTDRLCNAPAKGLLTPKPGAKPYAMLKATVSKLRYTVC